jgi:hypothetical protein
LPEILFDAENAEDTAMKMKVDVNLELELLEYELQRAEQSGPVHLPSPEGMEAREDEVPVPAARRAPASGWTH